MHKYMKRTAIIMTIMILASATLNAKFETWLGISLKGNTHSIAQENIDNFLTYMAPYTDISKENLQSINEIGPTIDIVIFPYYEIPIGIKLSNELLFPTGINSSKRFRSVQGDFSYYLKTGLDYAQSYNENFGLFASFGFLYNYNRISKTNIWNTVIKSEYYTYSDNGLYMELGLLTTISNGYFKFGIDYYHSLQNEAYSHSLIFAGGYRF